MSFFFYSNLFLRGNSRWGRKEGNLSVDIYKIFFFPVILLLLLSKKLQVGVVSFSEFEFECVCVDALGVGVGDAQFVKKHKNFVSEKLV